MPSSAASTASSKRLLFDRRYGWVLDEWKEPSEEALSGGRGMFCLVPLAKGMLKMASQSINVVASSTLKVIEWPDSLSPEVMLANFNDQVHKIASSVKIPEIDLMPLKRNFIWKSSS